MKYIHSKGIIHRNLKPDKILLDQNYHPRLLLSTLSYLSEDENKDISQVEFTDPVGSMIYSAPEIYSNQKYTYKVDVYSFSFVAFELLTNRSVFSGCGDVTQIQQDTFEGVRPDINLLVWRSFTATKFH